MKMQGLALNIGIATAVFYIIVMLFDGNGFGAEIWLSNAFGAVVFAMTYGAIQVALVIFRSGDS